jgi:hypothetical protein
MGWVTAISAKLKPRLFASVGRLALSNSIYKLLLRLSSTRKSETTLYIAKYDTRFRVCLRCRERPLRR